MLLEERLFINLSNIYEKLINRDQIHRSYGAKSLFRTKLKVQ